METKPISPEQHGIIDYVFSGIQLGGPAAIGMNKKATRAYQILGTKFLLVNTLTDTPAGIKKVISFKDHQKLDIAFIAGLSLLTFYKPIRKNRKALCFHLGFLSTAITHYLLTDYNEKPEKEFDEIWST